MGGEIIVSGLKVTLENLILKPLKKSDFKSFQNFAVEYDGEQIGIDEYLELYASKEFVFMQTGKLWVYLFEKKTANRFESGEILGYAEITPFTDNEKLAEVGYFIKQSRRGEGRCKVMLAMALRLCGNMGFETVLAKVDKSNLPSLGVLSSCGFEKTVEDGGIFEFELSLKNKLGEI